MNIIKDSDEEEDDHELSDEQDQPLPAQSSSVAVANPDGPTEFENDSPESSYPSESGNNIPSRDEEEAVEEEDNASKPTRSKKPAAKSASAGGITYFPINFGGNPGVVAIANSYSTGKGETLPPPPPS